MRRLTALALVLLVLAACSAADEPAVSGSGTPPPEGEPAPEGIEGAIAVDVADRQHTEDSVDYPNRPPVGGNHYPQPAPCDFYSDPADRPPDELIVHSLEHGAVWIAFQEDLPTEQQQFIQQSVQASDQVIATPYQGLRAPIVMTAWGRQLDLDSVDDPRYEQFLSTYVDGPTAPEGDRDC